MSNITDIIELLIHQIRDNYLRNDLRINIFLKRLVELHKFQQILSSTRHQLFREITQESSVSEIKALINSKLNIVIRDMVLECEILKTHMEEMEYSSSDSD